MKTRAYRCSALPSPHAMLVVHLFFHFHRFEHKGSVPRFRSRRQTSVFVFVCAASCAEQRVVSPDLVPILRSCSINNGFRCKFQKLVKALFFWWTTYLLFHSGCSSLLPVRCLHCQHHPRWQNWPQLQRVSVTCVNLGTFCDQICSIQQHQIKNRWEQCITDYRLQYHWFRAF